MKTNPFFSVITVCYNAENCIAKTIESIKNQSYSDFEFVVVDGKSTDATSNIVRSYQKSFEIRKIPLLLTSEKDEGIYNAMNKAVSYASGTYVIFMNAGDQFAQKTVLENVYKKIDEENEPDILYGDTINCREKCYRYVVPGNISSLREYGEMPFCHQSVFIRNEIVSELRFDEKYRICADHDFFLRCYLRGVYFKYIKTPIAIYEIGGISSKGNGYTVAKERLNILKCNETIPLWKFVLQKLKIDIKHMVRNILVVIGANDIIEQHERKVEEKAIRILGYCEEFPRIE